MQKSLNFRLHGAFRCVWAAFYGIGASVLCFRAHECPNRFFEVRITLSTGTQGLQCGFQLKFNFAALLLDVEFHCLIDETVLRAPKYFA